MMHQPKHCWATNRDAQQQAFDAGSERRQQAVQKCAKFDPGNAKVLNFLSCTSI
jgi:hypothetical protein